jgi:uncharacterized membrane protein
MMIGPVEFVVAAFNDQQKAGEVLKSMKELEKEGVILLMNAAIMTKDAKGKISVKETKDVDAKHGAVFGAIVGGLLGLLGGPVGVVVGAAAGAATGGVAANTIDMGFSNDQLRDLQETLKPGSSAILALIQHEWVDRVVAEMEQFGAELYHQALKAEMAAQLEEGKEAGAGKPGTEESKGG